MKKRILILYFAILYSIQTVAISKHFPRMWRNYASVFFIRSILPIQSSVVDVLSWWSVLVPSFAQMIRYLKEILFFTCINWTNSLLINLLFQKSYCRLRMSESFGSVFSWFLNPTRILNSRIEKNIEKCFAIIFENAKQMHLHIDKFNSIFVSVK